MSINFNFGLGGKQNDDTAATQDPQAGQTQDTAQDQDTSTPVPAEPVPQVNSQDSVNITVEESPASGNPFTDAADPVVQDATPEVATPEEVVQEEAPVAQASEVENPFASASTPVVEEATPAVTVQEEVATEAPVVSDNPFASTPTPVVEQASTPEEVTIAQEVEVALPKILLPLRKHQKRLLKLIPLK